MQSPGNDREKFPKVESVKRKAIALSQEALVKWGRLQVGGSLPLVIQPVMEGLSLLSWAADNKELIESNLLRHGAILFRNFAIESTSDFENLIKALSSELLEYRERSSPRTHVSGGVYTSTEYPPNQSIFLHNENSYAHVWPSKIFFFCRVPASQGGETPIADCRKVFTHIAPEIIERFSQRKVLYVRNFRRGFGLSWETVFQTGDKSSVEAYCHKSGYEYEWLDGDRLRTRRIGQAMIIHPQTGELVWFNHAAFFHISTLEAEVQDALLTVFKEHELPNNTYYGDGAPIELSVMAAIREAYQSEVVTFSWQRGDVLMLDNMLTAHGRMPFQGQRKVLVGMADPYFSSDAGLNSSDAFPSGFDRTTW